jgi:hypothetical protein
MARDLLRQKYTGEAGFIPASKNKTRKQTIVPSDSESDVRVDLRVSSESVARLFDGYASHSEQRPRQGRNPAARTVTIRQQRKRPWQIYDEAWWCVDRSSGVESTSTSRNMVKQARRGRPRSTLRETGAYFRTV